MAEQAPTTDPAPKQPARQIYPRSGWLLILRKILLLLRWYHLIAILVIYLALALFFQAHNDFSSLLNIYKDISLLTAPITQHALISIPVFIILGVFISLGYWAKKDEARNNIWSREAEMMRKDVQAKEWEKRPPPAGVKLRQTLTGHSGSIFSVAWSPDGRMLASGSADHTVRLWDAQTARALHTLTGHTYDVYSVAWSPDGRMLASGSDDHTVRLWDSLTGQCIRSLEGHTDIVTWVSFSPDSRLLGSKSSDGTVRLWRTDTWENVSTLYEYCDRIADLSFHPTLPVLATLGERGTAIRIWDLDVDTILWAHSSTSASYANAKVVLLGDSGVGKSGLGLVLSGAPFTLTESTHGRRIWNFDKEEIEPSEGAKETRETFLWDLAGQPGYRLIHQLHLNEVAVALVVFDARSETDPFAGVYHWDRAFRVARHCRSKKFWCRRASIAEVWASVPNVYGH